MKLDHDRFSNEILPMYISRSERIFEAFSMGAPAQGGQLGLPTCTVFRQTALYGGRNRLQNVAHYDRADLYRCRAQLIE
jgi:hypothetical protein